MTKKKESDEKDLPPEITENIPESISNVNTPPAQQLAMAQEATISGNEQKMEKAYKVSSKLFQTKAREVLSPEEQELLMEKIKDTDIIVVEGSYDRGQVVFRAMEIPHVVISPHQLQAIELNDEQILFINCPGSEISRDVHPKIKSFVEAGGMLVTTDWALTHVLEPIFPRFIKHNGVKTRDDVVRVDFTKEEDNFFAKFIDEQDEPLWWLEGASYPITILEKDAVKVLAFSREMKTKYGEGPIIVSFEVDKGIVFHMTSHLYLQRSESRSERQAQKSTAYLSQKSVSLEAIGKEVAQELEELSVSEVESAYTSNVAIQRMILEQKKRVKKRKEKK